MSGNGEWCDKHALSRGSGWATNRLVGNPGEMLTRNQKMVGTALGTKGRNPMNSSNIKGREIAMNSNKQEVYTERRGKTQRVKKGKET